MSEFKFACPVCGQHITADSKDTGSEIPCPTCFRKIIVPQAPSSDDPKFVLSASEANKPRPVQRGGATTSEGTPKAAKIAAPIVLIAALVLICAAGALLFVFRDKIFHTAKPVEISKPTNDTIPEAESPKPTTSAVADYTGPSLWTLDLSAAKIPDSIVSGAIHHKAFTCERATLTGSNLTLRVGRSGQTEWGLSIIFFNRQAEELSGKTAEIKPTDTTAPRVMLRWKEEDRKSKTFPNGYAMRVEFGSVANGVLPGKIFLCVPDESKSWVAGTFRAEIRHPSAPRPRSPAPTRP